MRVFFFESHKSRLKKFSWNLFQGHIEEQISILGSIIAPKNNSTPIKPSEGSTMTHEDEKMQHDISKLQEQVHQILLSKEQQKMKWKF